MLKFLTCVFSDPGAITAITNKWDWKNYLNTRGYILSDGTGKPTPLSKIITKMLTDNRLRLLKVCQIFIDPQLYVIERYHSPPTDDSHLRGEYSTSQSDSVATTSSSLSSSSDWGELMRRESFGSSLGTPYQPPSSQVSSVSSSASPRFVQPTSDELLYMRNQGQSTDPMVPEGGSLINKKYTKKNNHKSQNKNSTKSKNRKTTRKNGKFKRMIKKHTTKYKTYKRKANGRKLRGNKHRNNKTMRRYRCVRK
jgi:hypothetical protein